MRYFAILFFLVPLYSSGQARLYASVVAGTYQMRDLKDFQVELKNDYSNNGLDMKIVSKFPASLQAEAGLEWRLEQLTLGGFTNYTITKGQLLYTDYSGTQSAAQELERYSLGFKAMHYLDTHFQIYAKAAVTYSSLDLVFKTSLTNGGSDSEDLGFTSLGLSAEPGVQWEHPWHRLTFFAHVGYQLQFSGKTNYAEIDGAYLTNNHDEALLLNWSGVRVGTGVAFQLRRSK